MTTISTARPLPRPIAAKAPLQAQGAVQTATKLGGGFVGAVGGGTVAGAAWAGVGMAAFGYATAVGRAFIRNAPGWFLAAGVVTVLAGMVAGTLWGGKVGENLGGKLEGGK